MKKKLAIVLLNCIIVLFTATFSTFGQQNEVGLKANRITIKMEKQPLGLVFRYLMENYDIPIGFEWSLSDKDHNEYNFETNLPATAKTKVQSTDGKSEMILQVQLGFTAEIHPISVNFDNAKLEDVLNQIVGQMENYKWEINDDVVNIFPIQGRYEKFEKLLETKIANFTFEKGMTVRDVTANIKKLPEFEKFLKENNLVFFGTRNGALLRINAQYGRTIDAEMNFSNLTFRDLLNKITKIKKGGWILRWIRTRTSGRELIDIDI